MKTKWVDLFCGAGGVSNALVSAAHDAKKTVDLIAVNHWQPSILTHSHQHPTAIHYCESIEEVNPLDAVPSRRLDGLIAAPACTHHSNARGGKPMDNQSRCTPWHVLRWLQEIDIKNVLIENVPEFCSWGPLDETNRPIASEKGKYFLMFVRTMQDLGYTVDWKVLNSADYGAITSRRRLFLQARKGNIYPAWPRQTHAKIVRHTQGLFEMEDGIKPWRAVREIIDWSIPSKSIFGRKKSLAPKTLERIWAGLEKFTGLPFIAVMHNNQDAASLELPISTVTCSGAHHALVQPFITAYHNGAGGANRNYSIDEPVPTLDTSNRYGIVQAFLVKFYGNGANIASINEPLDTITTKDRFGLVQPVVEWNGTLWQVDIHFRMLHPRELAAAMSFPSEQKFYGKRADVVKQIGNAVEFNVAKAIFTEIFTDQAKQELAAA